MNKQIHNEWSETEKEAAKSNPELVFLFKILGFKNLTEKVKNIIKEEISALIDCPILKNPEYEKLLEDLLVTKDNIKIDIIQASLRIIRKAGQEKVKNLLEPFMSEIQGLTNSLILNSIRIGIRSTPELNSLLQAINNNNIDADTKKFLEAEINSIKQTPMATSYYYQTNLECLLDPKFSEHKEYLKKEMIGIRLQNQKLAQNYQCPDQNKNSI